MGDRIIGGKEDISYKSVDRFFLERNSINLEHRYNYVMYLDEMPEVAIQRDKEAKKRVRELLDIQPGMTVLDIGCGIGRWGELFCEQGTFYIGVDGSAKMIEMARENLADYSNKELFVGNACQLEQLFEHKEWTHGLSFDIIMVSGVLMYLNDRDVCGLLETIVRHTKANSQVCLIESMSEDIRLTLKDVYSEELKQYYSAIYRTVTEFHQMMSAAFGDSMQLRCDERMDFSDGMQKKREHVTMEHCVIWAAP